MLKGKPDDTSSRETFLSLVFSILLLSTSLLDVNGQNPEALTKLGCSIQKIRSEVFGYEPRRAEADCDSNTETSHEGSAAEKT